MGGFVVPEEIEGSGTRPRRCSRRLATRCPAMRGRGSARSRRIAPRACSPRSPRPSTPTSSSSARAIAAPSAGCCPGRPAERLLHGAPCAVAVAPRGYRGGPIRHIGVAYDGSPEAEAALHAAPRRSRSSCAPPLTVYCVVEPDAALGGHDRRRHRRRVAVAHRQGARSPAPLGGDRQRTGRSRSPRRCCCTGAPAEQIARRSAGVVDLLFAGSRGYGPLRRALLGSVSVRARPRRGLPDRHDPAFRRRQPRSRERARLTVIARLFQRSRRLGAGTDDLTRCASCGSDFVTPVVRRCVTNAEALARVVRPDDVVILTTRRPRA